MFYSYNGLPWIDQGICLSSSIYDSKGLNVNVYCVVIRYRCCLSAVKLKSHVRGKQNVFGMFAMQIIRKSTELNEKPLSRVFQYGSGAFEVGGRRRPSLIAIFGAVLGVLPG
jgi:hypothetical protein